MYHSRNPFLEMLAANGDEEELQPQQGPPGLQQQHQAPAPRPGKVQLSNFWPQAPDAWFEMADITTERERLAHVDSAMGFNILRAFMDLVENPPVVDPYVHRAEGASGSGTSADAGAEGNEVPACGGRQLPVRSEVLASLLKFCSPGEEGTAFFRAAFSMRPHLAGMELTDLIELAQMVDRLWLCHSQWPPSKCRTSSMRRTARRSWPPGLGIRSSVF